MKTPDHPDRHPPFTGAYNFRDLGGYETSNGRHVAIGRIYRSGTLAELTDADHRVLYKLGVRTIFDFRSTRERTHRPSNLPKDAAFVVWHRDHATSAADLVRAIAAPGATPVVSRQMINDFYRSLPYEQADSYRALFTGIAAGDLPAVFHCSAGKDRTGAAAALLLDVLGVARETVIEDYIFTDRYFERICSLVANDPESNHLTSVDPAIWAPMMRAERDYIETMFETIEARHGSAEGFMRDTLNLTSADIGGLRQNLIV